MQQIKSRTLYSPLDQMIDPHNLNIPMQINARELFYIFFWLMQFFFLFITPDYIYYT